MPALRHKLGTKKGVAGNVPARRGKACDKTILNRIAHRLGDDWDRARRRLCRKRWRRARGDDDVDVQVHEFRRETGEAIEVPFGIAVLDREVLTAPVPELGEIVQKRRRSWRALIRLLADRKIPDPARRARRLRPSRPAERGASHECEKIPPLHSITSSARRRNDSGIVKPMTLAVLRLMTSSKTAGCSIGMS